MLLLKQGGYRGFYSKNTIKLTPKVVNDIHKRGGTFLRTSRGGHDTSKIVDNIQDRGINQVDLLSGFFLFLFFLRLFAFFFFFSLSGML
jgi:6-phosphofructokinase